MNRCEGVWPLVAFLVLSASGCSVFEGEGSDNYRSSITRALVWPDPTSVRVYLSPLVANTTQQVAEEDREAIRSAFLAWTSGLPGMAVRFVHDEAEADVTVRFAVSSPGIAIAQTTVVPASSTTISKVTMLFVVNPAPHSLALTALHEVGRALGMVEGRSPYPFDVMSGQPNLIAAPSSRDIETLRLIYLEQGIEI